MKPPAQPAAEMAILTREEFDNRLRAAAFCHECDAPAMESYLAPVLAHDAALRAEVERLRAEKQTAVDADNRHFDEMSKEKARADTAEAELAKRDHVAEMMADSALVAVKAERDRYREALRDAPHGHGCNAVELHGPKPFPCNCWKRTALDGGKSLNTPINAAQTAQPKE
jgi:hypothetical protein